MSTEPESFLARWSRRKRAAEEANRPADNAAPQPTAPASTEVSAAPSSASAPAESTTTKEVPLPPIESLDGLRSDYQAFFQQPVAEDLRHAALRKLFADPHFNKMDMLDVYVDDYTQFEPLPTAMKLSLKSARAFLSDSERAELESTEARTGDGKAPVAQPAIDDVAADSTAAPSETNDASTTSNVLDGPLDASSSPARASGQGDT